MSDPLLRAKEALDACLEAAKDDDSQITLRTWLRLDELMSATGALITECERALHEGDWA